MTSLSFFPCKAMEEEVEPSSHPSAAASFTLKRSIEKKGNLEDLFLFLQTKSRETHHFGEIFYLECAGRTTEEDSQGPLSQSASITIKQISFFETSPQGKKRLDSESSTLTQEAQQNARFLETLKSVVDLSCLNFPEISLSLSPQRENPLHSFSFSQIKRYFVSKEKERKDISLRSFLEKGVCLTQKQNILLTEKLANGHQIEIDLETEFLAPLKGQVMGISYIGNCHNGDTYVYAHIGFPFSQDVQFVDISSGFLFPEADPNPFSKWIFWKNAQIHGVIPKKAVYTRFSYERAWWKNWASYSDIQEHNLKLQTALTLFAEKFHSDKKENPAHSLGETLIDLPQAGFYQILDSQSLESSSFSYPGPQSGNVVRYVSTQQLWVRKEKTSEVFSFAALMMTPLTLHFLNCTIPETIHAGIYSCEIERKRASHEEAAEAQASPRTLSLRWRGKDGSIFPIEKKDPHNPYRFEVFQKDKLVSTLPFFKALEEEEIRSYVLQRKQERSISEGAEEDLVLSVNEGTATEEEREPSQDEREKRRFLKTLNTQNRGNVFQESHIAYHKTSGSYVSKSPNMTPDYKLLEITRSEWKSPPQDEQNDVTKKNEKKINLWEQHALAQIKENPWSIIQSLITHTGHYFSEREPADDFKLSLLASDTRSPLKEVSNLKRHTWVESSSVLSLQEYLEHGFCEITRYVTLFSGVLSDGRRLSLTIETSHQSPLMAKIIGVFYALNATTKETSVYFHAQAPFLGGTHFVLASKTVPEETPNPSHMLPDWVYWEKDHVFGVRYRHPIFTYDPTWLQNWVLEDSTIEHFFCRLEDSFLKERKTKGKLLGIVPVEDRKDSPALYKILKTKRTPSNIFYVERESPCLKSTQICGLVLRAQHSAEKIPTMIYKIGSSEITPLNFQIPTDLPSGFYEIIETEEGSSMTWKSLGRADIKKPSAAAASQPEASDTSLESTPKEVAKVDRNKSFGFRLKYEEKPDTSPSQLPDMIADAQNSLFLTSLHFIVCPTVLKHLDALKKLSHPLNDLSFNNCALTNDLPDDFFDFMQTQQNLKQFDFSGNPISEASFNHLIGVLSSFPLQELSIDAPRKKSSPKKRGAAGGLTGAASGAVIGFFVGGPPGALIGGVAGGLTGGASAAKASDARAFAKRNKASDFTVKSFIIPVQKWPHLHKLSIHGVKRSEKGCNATKNALEKIRGEKLPASALEIEVFPRSLEEGKDLPLDLLRREDKEDDLEEWQAVDIESSDEDD
ncbi:MAG: hypothetical protein JSS34_01600 [Proteobacteria bacterium]|nr:hypothetical protein [Pseudomonadota bacterium]